MAKQLNVNLNFTADTKQVEANLNKLRTSLNEIASIKIMGSNNAMNLDLGKAVKSAQSLQYHLNNAFNVKTGNLDLGKFQVSLHKNNQSLSELASNLSGAGKTGQQAFLSLTKALTSANIKISQTDSLMNQMKNTFANTLRWQAASTVIHSITAKLSEAYGYAEKLNKSLTNIRIVAPEKSIEDMAKFAEQANEAAKELSTSTLNYTEAALIYYQQGLEDTEVAARSDVTIKLANVTGDSADEVSSYMTSIWNNFNKAGDESEEHYADILAKLGADTAASTSEITTALEKYSAVAETIGLSYEAATAAATTLIDRTRETPEVAGTALKTIFARMQGLQQGEEQDDGTTLNKYSTALAKIGVNIKDNNGELRDADDILDETGEKWQDLSRDQQVALAETVAGVRQWNQFAALMDNYDYYKKYKEIAETGSEGALQEQQDIYAESWEAASNRVKAAWQSIYDELLDDQFFIKLTNLFADLTEGVDFFITSIGGLKGTLLLLSTILLKVFKADITAGLDTAINKVGIFKKSFVEGLQQAKIAANATALDTGEAPGFVSNIKAGFKNATSSDEMWTIKQAIAMNEKELTHSNLSEDYKVQIKNKQRINTLNLEILESSQQITSAEKENLQVQLQEADALSEQLAKSQQVSIQAKQRLQDKQRFYENEINNIGRYNTIEVEGKTATLETKERNEKGQKIMTGDQDKFIQNQIDTRYNGEFLYNKEEQKLIFKNDKQAQNFWGSLTKNVAQYNGLLEKSYIIGERIKEGKYTEIDLIKKEYTEAIKNSELSKQEQENLLKRINDTNTLVDLQETVKGLFANGVGESELLAEILGQTTENIGEIGNLAKQNIRQEEEALEKARLLEEKFGQIGERIAELQNRTKGLGGNLTKIVSGFSSVGLGLSMMSGAFETLQDEEASTLEKITSISFAVGMLPSMLSGIKDSIGGIGELLSGGIYKKIILGAIVAITALIVALKKMKNAAKEAYEEAANAAQEASEAASSAASEYSELIDTITSIQDAEDALSDLAEGTTEWKQAVTELNDQILQLLQTYPELAQYINNEDGVLSIEDEGYDEILNTTLQKVNYTQQVATDTQIAANTANSEYLIDDFEQGLDSNEQRIYSKGTIYTLLNSYLENGSSAFVDLEENKNPLYTEEYVSKLEELIEALAANTKSNESLQYSGTVSFLENSVDNYSENSEKDAIANYTSAYRNSNSNLTQAIKNIDQLDKEAKIDKYIELNQLDEEDYEKGAFGSFKVRDSEGTLQKVEMKDIESQLISNEQNNLALDKVKEFWNEALYSKDGFGAFSDNFTTEVNDEIINAVISSSDNLADGLNSMTDEAFESLNNMDSEEREKRLKDLYKLDEATFQELGYTQVRDFVNGVTGALDAISDPEDSEGYQAEKEANIEQENQDFFDETAEEFDLESGVVESLTNSILEANPALVDLAENEGEIADQAKDAIKSQIRLEKGFDSLVSSFEDGEEVLDGLISGTIDKDSVEASEALNSVRNAVEEMLGIDVSDNFIKENLEEIKKVAEGDEEAFNNLKVAAAQDYVANMDITIDENAEGDTEEGVKSELNNIISKYQALLDDSTLTMGAQLDDKEMVESLNEMLSKGEVTKEQIEAIFGSMGVSYKWEKDDSLNQTTETTHEITTSILGKDVKVAKFTDKATMQGYKIVADKGKSSGTGGGGSYKDSSLSSIDSSNYLGSDDSSGSGSGSSGSSGSSSRRSTIEETDSEIDRYKEEDEKLDKISSLLDEISEKKDNTYGKNRLNAMKENNKELLKEINLLKKKNKEAQNYLKTDKSDLKQAVKKLQKEYNKTVGGDGVSNKKITTELKINNKTGEIENYTELLEKYQKELNKRERHYNKLSASKQEDYQEKYIDPLKEKIEELQEAVDQYEETRELIIELREQIDEAFSSWQEQNYEKLQYALELKINIKDNELKILEAKIAALEGNVYKSAESFALLQNETSTASSEYSDYVKNLNQLNKSYAAGTITQADWADGLQECFDNLSDLQSTLIDYKEQVEEYYGDTLESAIEELDKYNTRLEYASEILEHYQSILELTNQTTNYNFIKAIQKQQKEINQEQIRESEGLVANLKTQLEMAKNALDADPDNSVLKTNYEVILEDYNEAQNELLSSIEEGIELAGEALTTKLDEIADKTQDTLTGIAGGFDEIIDRIGLTSQKQDEYLTKTNQQYELSKMQRQLNKDIDKTTSKASKSRLAEFSSYISNLQSQNSLSNIELDIAQKKYDLLKAQIALEESQNSKSTVRLSRDSEGNFGYVYTANEEAVSDAEQAVEDAENALYNTQLEGVNNYNQKLIEASRDYYNAIAEVSKDETLSDDEKTEKLKYLQGVYEDLIGTYADLAGVSKDSTDYLQTALEEEAYVYSNYNDVITQMTTNSGAFNEMIDESISAIQNYTTAINTLTASINYSSLSTAITDALGGTVSELGEDYDNALVETGNVLIETLQKIIDYVGGEDWEALITAIGTNIPNTLTSIADKLETASTTSSSNGAFEQFVAEASGGNTYSTSYNGAELLYNKDAGVSKNRALAIAENDKVQKYNDSVAEKMIDYKNEHPMSEIYYWFDKDNKLHYRTTKEAAEKTVGKNNYTIRAFDTGGYTGDWGSSDGRLALLHQKELVLNEVDTSNILSAVEAVRDMTSTGILNSLKSIGLSAFGKSDDTIEQSVQIEASFPNVNTRQDIEDAFSNLINKATQYAYKTK